MWQDVWDIDDVAAHLGYKVSHARNNIVGQDGFPEPRKKSGQVRLWDAREVRVWAQDRQPGRWPKP